VSSELESTGRDAGRIRPRHPESKHGADQTTLVELGLADGKQSLIKIHVLAIQLDGLANA
jgi:hypothetical protein